jgi:hypothetical protein
MSQGLHRVSSVRAIFATGALLIVGCGNSGQSVDPGTQTTETGGAKLTVVLGASSVSVDLGSVATTAYNGTELVLLSDVWTAAALPVDHTTLEFGFEADDGFTPASVGCAYLPGADLDLGYIDPTSRNLVWDESLGLRGCYSVGGAKTMTGHTPVVDAGTDGG